MLTLASVMVMIKLSFLLLMNIARRTCLLRKENRASLSKTDRAGEEDYELNEETSGPKNSKKRCRGALEDRKCPDCGRVFTSVLGRDYHVSKYNPLLHSFLYLLRVHSNQMVWLNF